MNERVFGSPKVVLLEAFLGAESCAAAQVPPALHRFTKAADKNLAETIFKLLLKYRPEDKAAKKQRLLSEVRAAPCSVGAHVRWPLAFYLTSEGHVYSQRQSRLSSPVRQCCRHISMLVGWGLVLRGCVTPRLQAEAREKGTKTDKKKPVVVKYGLNHVTHLVETGKAKLVVIAHDVDPIELVVWLPAVCRKMDVPYIIVKVCAHAHCSICTRSDVLQDQPCAECLGYSEHAAGRANAGVSRTAPPPDSPFAIAPYL